MTTGDDFTPIMDASGRQKVAKGIPVWKVVGTTLGLKIGAFLLIAL